MHASRHTDRQTYIGTCMHASRHTDRQTYIGANYKGTNFETYIKSYI